MIQHFLITAYSQNKQLQADFDGEVAAFSQTHLDGVPLRMQLNAYGYGENIQPVIKAEATINGNRLEYRRGNITEWYISHEHGVEQGFYFSKASTTNYFVK